MFKVNFPANLKFQIACDACELANYHVKWNLKILIKKYFLFSSSFSLIWLANQFKYSFTFRWRIEFPILGCVKIISMAFFL